MQPHVKIYMSYFGYGIDDKIICEVTGEQANDIHHIEPRSRFGKKRKDEQDDIMNLIALSRRIHNDAHDNFISRDTLTKVHLDFMKRHGKPTNP